MRRLVRTILSNFWTAGCEYSIELVVTKESIPDILKETHGCKSVCSDEAERKSDDDDALHVAIMTLKSNDSVFNQIW